jgi:endonuclease/exonuclease/phosphatase family metal-dependent hydrolase
VYIVRTTLTYVCLAVVTPSLTRCAPQEPAGHSDFRILTWNVLWTNRDHPETAQFIRETAADVVFLQEVTPELEARLRLDLASLYSGMVFSSARSGRGYAILSRYPVIGNRHLANPQGGPPACWAELRTPAGRLQVLNLHLTNPRVLVGSWFDKIKSYATTAGVRLKEVRNFCDALKTGVPAVVAGDLNSLGCEPSITYLSRRARLTDAYRAVHPTPSKADITWTAQSDPLSPMKARIDYVFVSRELVPLEAHTGHTTLSDHQPVTVILRWQHKSNEDLDCPRPSSGERP